MNFPYMSKATNRSLIKLNIIVCVCLLINFSALAKAQTQTSTPTKAIKKKAAMIKHATGTFEVKVFPLTATDESANLVRMLLDKRFSGDLTAVSKGEMLADNNGTKDSGGYVAMERVTGTLGDKSGTFVLQHSGTMINGVAQMSVTVVPESGTNQLTGLTGKMMINIENGKHSYDFEYTLPAASENKQKD